jgi:hypothetical protein
LQLELSAVPASSSGSISYLRLISVLSFLSKYRVLAEGINILKALANQDNEITATHMTDEPHIGQTKDMSKEEVSLSHDIHVTK